MTVTNGFTKFKVDDTVSMVLIKQLGRKSMGISVEDTVEAHYSN